MERTTLIAYVIFDVVACILNQVTLKYVMTSFDIRTHVFTLLFLDSLNCSICAIISTITDTILLTEKQSHNYFLCSAAFMASYLPNCFGANLTLLIAVTRYTLTLKSAKNIHPTDSKVTILVLSIFAMVVCTVLFFFLYNFILGIPTTYFIEACAHPGVEPRILPKLTMLFLFHPYISNILSLVTDIKMLILLKKVIMPSRKNGAPNGAGKII